MDCVRSVRLNWSKLARLLVILPIGSSTAASAQTETGACGLEAGIWGKSSAVCALASQPDEAARQFGGSALLEWERRNYVQNGNICGIFTNKIESSNCTITFECGRAMGHTNVEIISSHEMRFGIGAASTYIYCGKGQLPVR